jgi:hypothetical protein
MNQGKFSLNDPLPLSHIGTGDLPHVLKSTHYIKAITVFRFVLLNANYYLQFLEVVIRHPVSAI